VVVEVVERVVVEVVERVVAAMLHQQGVVGLRPCHPCCVDKQ